MPKGENQYTKAKLPLPPGKKMCTVCRWVKDVTEFYPQYGVHRNGKPRTDRSSCCKECKKKKAHEYSRKKREETKKLRESQPKIEVVEPSEKKCKTCGRTKPIEKFYVYKKKRNGSGHYRRGSCSTCLITKTMEYQKKKREKSG